MAIICYHGLQGQGKTYGLVHKLVETMREKPVQVYTNIATLNCPWVIYIDHVDEIINISSGIVILDEAGIILPSQYWQEVGRDLLTRLCQMRKNRLDLWYTVQRYGGVNVNLREQTNEAVECRKYGPYFHFRSEYPARKTGGGSKLVRFSPSIASCYDTYDTITKTGGSNGRAEDAAPPPFCSRSVAANKKRKGTGPEQKIQPVRSLLEVPWWARVGEQATILRPRPEAMQVLQWLKDHGHYDVALPWHEQVRAETQRREWLAVWGMTCEDVPPSCTPLNPWSPGFDPETVKLRRAEREEQSAFVTAVAKTEARRALKAVTTR